MTSIQVVQEVQRLLRLECYSHKEIGKMLGISRNTVGSVALGKHRNCNAEEEENTSVGPPRICPICGWNVLMPCVVCRTREYMSDHPLVFKKEVDAELSVDLREDHRRRYEELVSRRPQDGSFEDMSWWESLTRSTTPESSWQSISLSRRGI